jgi:6-phosphogluconolactonase
MLAAGRNLRILAVAVAAAAAVLTAFAGSAAAKPFGTVYTSTNGATGNEIRAFERAPDGSLRPAGSFATGGVGTGAGLGNQGAVVLADDGRRLFAVNAGSDTITSFKVTPRGPRLRDLEPSGGDRPISLTVHGDLLYVLNAGSDQISGFRIRGGGDLQPLARSTRNLSGAGTDPAQVEFSPDGALLVVTEKATNRIDTFRLGRDGRPGQVFSQPSAGETPFGFAFDKRGNLIVSEAFGGAENASALSSYRVGRDGAIAPISPVVRTEQTAACWVVVTRNGRFAYTTNTGSGSISSYAVERDGSISLLESVAANTGAGSAPTDLALDDDRHLFVLNSGTGTVGSYRVRADGSLAPVDVVGGLPAGSTGLAAS